MSKLNTKLNKRQLTYCYWRARSNTIEESMVKAGFTCKGASARSWGSQLEDKLNIKERIEQERLNIFNKAMITEEYVLKGLKDIAEQGKQEANKVMAFQLLGKYLAMFTDKTENKTTITEERKAELLGFVTRLGITQDIATG